jgi:hypothetical protein
LLLCLASTGETVRHTANPTTTIPMSFITDLHRG